MSSLNKFAQDYLEEANFHLLPIWVSLMVLAGWLGLLSIFVFAGAGVETAEVQTVGRNTKILMYMFVLIPLLSPVLRVAVKRWCE